LGNFNRQPVQRCTQADFLPCIAMDCTNSSAPCAAGNPNRGKSFKNIIYNVILIIIFYNISHILLENEKNGNRISIKSKV